MPTTVTLSLDSLPIDEQTVKTALAEQLHGKLLTHPAFQAAVTDAIRNTGPDMVAKAVAESVNHDLLSFMRSKIQPLKDELNQVLRDFDNLALAHASEYAARRKKELLAKISELNSL